MTEYHESWEALPQTVRDQHRALKSLQEEIEAVDWYNQRVAASDDAELTAILAHNRDEEIEHALMLLEWLRRSMPGWDERMATYLFSAAPITEIEEQATGQAATAEPRRPAGLGIGSLKEGE